MSPFARLERVECSLELPPEDRLRVGGADARDFLHRISASEVRDLADKGPHHLLFTDDKGGLVDAPLACAGADGYRLFAGPGRGRDLRAWLERWIIVDDVVVEPDPEPAWFVGEPDGATGRLIRPSTPAGPPVQVGAPATDTVTREVWDARCFRAGRFFAGTATASSPNPLELGWKQLVAFDKGCYIGQEVIARMDTYEKVRRGLATMSLSASLPGGTPVSREGRKCGVILGSVDLDEGPFAWAIVDRTLEAGAETDDGATVLEIRD